ncbi:MAG: TatD family hydrolase [Cyanobacteria bacterium P01_H01_bin.105]
MQLVDSHVHIHHSFDSLSFQTDLDEVAAAWRQAGVVHLVHSCVQPSEFEAMQAIADRFTEVSFAVGLHPEDMDQWTPDLAEKIHHLALADRRVVAIGETGLDFYKGDDQACQIEAFRAQLSVAYELDLPVIIHCRDASAAVRDVLKSFAQEHGPVRGVMHCWTGSPEETQWFLDLGFYISFSGIVTFKSATQVQASAKMVGCDRILIETDCPFLSPVPKRKEKRNQPANVLHVAEFVADLRGVSLEVLAKQTTDNARTLFKLPDASFAVSE